MEVMLGKDTIDTANVTYVALEKISESEYAVLMEKYGESKAEGGDEWETFREQLDDFLYEYHLIVERKCSFDEQDVCAGDYSNSVFSVGEIGTDGDAEIQLTYDENNEEQEATLSLKTDLIARLRGIEKSFWDTQEEVDAVKNILKEYDSTLRQVRKNRAGVKTKEKKIPTKDSFVLVIKQGNYEEYRYIEDDCGFNVFTKAMEIVNSLRK